MAQSAYFVMDPIESINPKKDTTLALMFEAHARGMHVFMTEPAHLWVDRPHNREITFHARCRQLLFGATLVEYTVQEPCLLSLTDATYIFMRQDPPVTVDYINTTFILEMLADRGVIVVNDPAQVRSANEKLTALRFPTCCPDTIVSTRKPAFHKFLHNHRDIVIKPLDGMGGQGVFRVKFGDQNLDSIIEVLTRNGQQQIMAQAYIPEISEGDTRILMVGGEPIRYGLARRPQDGALRGNLAAGATGIGRDLTARDLEICAEVGPWLKAHRIYFAGLDVIGPYLTEVNVTSPTCVRELDNIYNLNISGQLFDLLSTLS